MTKWFLSAASLTFILLLAQSPARANSCINCIVQSRTASTKTPDKFDFRVVCIELQSGDEIASLITASSEEEALSIMNETKCL